MWWFKAGLSVLFIGFLGTCLVFKKDVIACEAVSWSNFNELAKDVYVDDSLNVQQRRDLLASINAAVARVTAVYGAPEAPVRIIAFTDPDYGHWGFNLTGMQMSGLSRECVFIGPRGINVDVIAHELVHAEVRYRTDLWTELTQLPAWFIEGTGIRVDQRPPFIVDNINIAPDYVESIKQVFYLSDFANTNVAAYQASKLAVLPMPAQELYSGLERLNRGESFQQVFMPKRGLSEE